MALNKKKYVYIVLALLLGIAIISLSVVLLVGRAQEDPAGTTMVPSTGSSTIDGNGTTNGNGTTVGIGTTGVGTTNGQNATVNTTVATAPVGSSQPSGSVGPTGTGTTEPEDTKPDATEPEETKPDATEPEDTKPDATKPEDTKPDATEPEDTKPDATEPEDTKPDATEPEDTKPDATEPEDTKPDATEPEETEPETTEPETTEPKGDDGDDSAYEDEGDKLEEALGPAQITLLKPEASGVLVVENDNVILDYSNTDDGYVMVKYLTETTKKLKVQVKGPTTTYTYNIKVGEWTVFPLSDGNGDYTVTVYENTTGNKYSRKLRAAFPVEMEDEFAPFLRPNQYVNYENATNTMNKAASLLNNQMTVLEKVSTIYDYVINTLSYDYDKAETVQSGYLPDLDAVLKAKKGICFDYAALMTAMLRSQNIPCKLVVGYADTTYHAWISVWSPETGWVDGAIFFNGTTWALMDPTYASGGMDIDDINYSSKYIY